MNFLAIIVAAIVNVALGAVWYSPALFAKPWSRGVGMSKERMAKGMQMSAGMFVPPLIAALITSYVLDWFLQALHVTTVGEGIWIGFLAWLGFTTTAQVLNSWVFSNGLPKQVYLINTGYHLVVFCIMGAILAAWR